MYGQEWSWSSGLVVSKDIHDSMNVLKYRQWMYGRRKSWTTGAGSGRPAPPPWFGPYLKQWKSDQTKPKGSDNVKQFLLKLIIAQFKAESFINTAQQRENLHNESKVGLCKSLIYKMFQVQWTTIYLWLATSKVATSAEQVMIKLTKVPQSQLVCLKCPGWHLTKAHIFQSGHSNQKTMLIQQLQCSKV